MRIVFAGTPDFAATSLSALIEAGHDIMAVYTQPDRPAGRGRKARRGPVSQLAHDHGLRIEQPESLRNDEAQATLRDIAPDVMVIAAYGLILPQPVLDIPDHGCLNVHASLLPRWRGAAPIQWAIAAGDSETGISIMQMDAGLDTGDVVSRHRIPIMDDETGGSLHDRLAESGGKAITGALHELAHGSLAPEPQDDHRATYARKLERSDGRIDWQSTAQSLARRIRAFNPWPMAHSTMDDDAIRVLSAEAVNTDVTDSKPGTVLAREPAGALVQCGEGVIRITRVQLPGGRPQSVRDLINGGRPVLLPGQRLGQ
ncbi:methionyl-tRNA formyltransferase [Salicola sp. Rm-C-2C1-2]|uniref:methionyl-tRNA formyltransferase n=1 Tax=Salicola sp. Rm-C-2C1-2 TaxID=3141321 RepID=UPI0032E37696